MRFLFNFVSQDAVHNMPESYQVPVLGLAFVSLAAIGCYAQRPPVPTAVFAKEVQQALEKLNSVANRVEIIAKDAKKLQDEYLQLKFDV